MRAEAGRYDTLHFATHGRIEDRSPLALAGSPNVVASHWKVDAASTTVLMTAFHARVQRAPGGPADAAEALRQASLALRRDARYRHPFYWAGFFLTGRGVL